MHDGEPNETGCVSLKGDTTVAEPQPWDGSATERFSTTILPRKATRMSSIPAGKRRWNCPDCGGEVLLSITQLDPLACEACLAKLKGGGSSGKGSAAAVDPVGNVLQTVNAQPVGVKLAGVGILAMLVGLLIGFAAGRVSAPQTAASPAAASSNPTVTRSTSRDEEPALHDQTPDESTRPGPGHRWVKGYTRKDGVKVKGHWARDPNYRE